MPFFKTSTGTNTEQESVDQVLLQKISDSINAGIIVLAPDCSVSMWNQWMEEKTSFKKKSVLGRKCYSVFPGLTNIRFKKAISEAIKKGRSAVLSQSIHKSPLPLYSTPGNENSELLNHSVEVQPLSLDSGSENYCLIQINCVENAVKREEELRQQSRDLSKTIDEYRDSEMRVHAMAEISEDAIITFDKLGIVESVNSQAEEMFGYEARELMGVSGGESLIPDLDGIWEMFTSVISKKVMEVRGKLTTDNGWQLLLGKHKDGSLFPVYLKLSKIDLIDRPLIVCRVRDLTEIEASKRILSDSKATLELAMECGHIAMWDWDVVSNEINNESLLVLLEYDPATCEIPWEKLVHPDDFDRVNTCVESYVAGVIDELDIEYRVRAASNEWLWIHDAGKVVERDEKDRPKRIIGVNQIIHQRKTAELEAIDTSEKLIEAARVKSEFLSNMSHELRTPMNGIIGILNLLESSMNSEEEQEYINVGKNSANSLLKLIDDVLDFTKLGAKSVQLEVLEFPPEEILKDVVKLLSETAVNKALSINYQLDNSLMTDHEFSIATDPLRLRQVLTNLVGNAIKFTEQGQVQIRVNRLENDHILFEVEDTGIGIPQDRQEIIFDAFAQADLSTTRKFGGTGLGLVISRELVEIMGGTISVVSAPGEGSIFSFTVKDHSKQSLRSQQNELESV